MPPVTTEPRIAVRPPSGLPYSAIPVEGKGPGRFMYASPVVLTAAMISANGWAAGLPSALSGGDIVCFWGSDFEYRGSNVYLGCMAANKTTIETASYGDMSIPGVSAMYYLSSVDANGNTVYVQGDETQSTNLLTSFNHGGATTPCVGEISVRWIPPLRRFLMTYGSETCGGLWYRTSATPWGPWTVEANFFPNDGSSGWMQKLVYPPGASMTAPDPNTQTKVDMNDPVNGGTINNSLTIPPYFQPGNPYGAYQYPGSTAHDNGDGTVSVFMNFSGYNYYVAWQMTARFFKAPSVTFTGHVGVSAQLRVMQ